MKIQLIGTGNMVSTRNSASTLINEHILFDVPNGCLKGMMKQNIDVSKIDTFIISHTHGDHNFDMPFVLLNDHPNCDEKHPLKIITDEVSKQSIKSLITASHFFDNIEEPEQKYIDISEVDNMEIINGLDIQIEKMSHKGVKFATGYILKDGKVSLGLTGDTGMCEGVERLASKVDYLIADMSKEEGNEAHMGINDIQELLSKNPKLKIIPTHMHDRTREIAKGLNIDNLIILDDGGILNI